MTTNAEVAKAWANGNVSNSRNMSTDGHTIWSYDLPIGHIHRDGAIYIRNATAALGRFYSITTSTKHMPPTMHEANRLSSRDGGTVIYLDDEMFKEILEV